MDNKVVSVIVPVYNAEKYIDRCISSIVNQSYKTMEIILVNDGSDDHTLEKCNEWKRKDKRVKVISYELNRGVSSARNKGIEYAGGEYVAFVDSDDFVEKDFIAFMAGAMEYADLAICGYSRAGKTSKKYVIDINDPFISREFFYYHALCTGMIQAYCCNKMFRTEIIRQNGLLFHENVYIGEDMVFLLEYMEYSKKSFYISIPLYHYYKNPDSAFQKVYSGGKLSYREKSCLKALDCIQSLNCFHEKKIKSMISYRIIKTSVWLLLQMILSSEKDENIFKLIKVNCRKNYFRALLVPMHFQPEVFAGAGIAVSPHLVYIFGTKVLKNNKKILNKYLQ